MANKKVTRPILRYHGGKWLLAPWVISHFPPHKIYVEPYGGAASVLLQKERSFTEVYNDIDDDVVNVFRTLREHGPELRELLRLTPYARMEYFAAYEPALDSVERARRVILRTFLGFGSDSIRRLNGFRKRSDSSGTTPAHDWRNFSDQLEATIERLRGVVIENRDALKLIGEHDGPDTLYYVDPPYVRSTRKAKGYKHEVDDEHHIALAKALHALKGKVIVSGYHSPLYDELYKDWFRDDVPALADGAAKRTEVVWMNYELRGTLFDLSTAAPKVGLDRAAGRRYYGRK